MAPKSILISGGARGIGRCLARSFLEKGDNVYILDIDVCMTQAKQTTDGCLLTVNQEEELNYTVRTHLKKHEGHVAYSVCDLSSEKDIRDKVKVAADYLNNRIDVFVSNAGIASPHWKDDLDMSSPEVFSQWQAYMGVNLTAPFLVSQCVIPYMRQDNTPGTAAEDPTNAGPCIILIGSFRAHQSDPNQEGYAASKAGQLGLMQAMSISLGKMGIRVNLIAPGRIKVGHESKEGDENGGGWSGQHEEKDEQDHPTNRAGMPEDISHAADYLVGAGFVTGQEIIVDGGSVRKK
jgi:NAD(P)-dependent dehydrogenase (short-subunit alcohol dehydrogenase family)